MVGDGLEMRGDTLNVNCKEFFSDTKPLGKNNIVDHYYYEGESPSTFDEQNPTDEFSAKFIAINKRNPRLGDIQLYEDGLGIHRYYYFTTEEGHHKTGSGSPFFAKNEFAAATFLSYSDKTWSVTPDDYNYSPEQTFRDNNGRPSR